ncbi:MAG: uracil-DNA glycosylase [Proteobacteria bacterium]|jgi:DNA polymerase|nr:uracil-DNA glycosylase [Pseudomonadota bacterium]
MLTKSQKLDMIAEKIKKCQKCPDLLCRTNTVPGCGDPDAKIVCLGEAPGKDEDQQGIPFVGKAGKLLNNMLSACGIIRESVFVLNILKCRPPANRTPTPEESKNCKNFLDLQLKVIAPQYILCLGACAAQNLLGEDTPISQMRGKWYNYNGIKVLCTFHPAYLLRQPDRKKDAWADLQMLIQDV